ncbi:hypothetical protein ACFLV7_09900 [Chloroflexota bacterium]
MGRQYSQEREVSIFGSRPPGDDKFHQDIKEAVIGDWDVEVQGRKHNFWINYANTFDEPVGGLMNVLLTEEGQHYQHTEISGGYSLVIDIGGSRPIIWRSTLVVKWITTWGEESVVWAVEQLGSGRARDF